MPISSAPAGYYIDAQGRFRKVEEAALGPVTQPELGAVAAEQTRYPGLNADAALGGIRMRSATSPVSAALTPEQQTAQRLAAGVNFNPEIPSPVFQQQTGVTRDAQGRIVPTFEEQPRTSPSVLTSGDARFALENLQQGMTDFETETARRKALIDRQRAEQEASITASYGQKVARTEARQKEEANVFSTRLAKLGVLFTGSDAPAAQAAQGAKQAQELQDLEFERDQLLSNARAAANKAELDTASELFKLAQDKEQEMYTRSRQQFADQLSLMGEERAQRKDALDQLGTIATTGRELSAPEIDSIASDLGLDTGFVSTWYEAQRSATTAKSEEEKRVAEMKLKEFALKMDPGTSTTIGGVTVTSLQTEDPDVYVIQKEDENGVVRAEAVDKKTGETLWKKDYGAIGTPSKKAGGKGVSLTSPNLSGTYPEDYLLSRANQYVFDDGSINWIGLDKLENVDKVLWSDMTKFLSSTLTVEEETPTETTPEELGRKPLTETRIGKATKSIFGKVKPVVGEVIKSTKVPGLPTTIGQVASGIRWLFE